MHPSSLREKWLSSPAVRKFELGRSSPEEFAQTLIAEWRLTCEFQTFLAEFALWPKGFFPGVTDVLAKLRQRYKVACLSNSNALHWTQMTNALDHFHISLSSHVLGVIKPDADCFHRALQECGVSAADVAFFDDSLANVDSARGLGIQAFHVDGFDQVQKALRPFLL
jgi:putative hydrolase of the HAD superfamily